MNAPTNRRSTRADELCSTLSQSETAWKDRQEFLQSRGYMLRPRYRPEWTPSWRETGEHPFDCEDSIPLPHRPSLIDATRISDGELVYLKRVKTGDLESQLATMLSSPHLRLDSRNHCVPVLDFFEDPHYSGVSYMVMPFLRLMDDPPFECVDDLLDFGQQILEGLVFLHEQGVAHRDCSRKNLMMDAKPLYPNGFHPVRGLYLPDARTPVSPRSRKEAPVKYYFVDFGISTHIPPDVHPKLAVGADGRDQEPPELSLDVPYDPFKLDTFIIGNVFRRDFFDKFSNIEFLQPIVEAMTHAEPSARPNAAEVLRIWRSMQENIDLKARVWRLKPREENLAEAIIFDTGSLLMNGIGMAQSLFG